MIFKSGSSPTIRLVSKLNVTPLPLTSIMYQGYPCSPVVGVIDNPGGSICLDLVAFQNPDQPRTSTEHLFLGFKWDVLDVDEGVVADTGLIPGACLAPVFHLGDCKPLILVLRRAGKNVLS